MKIDRLLKIVIYLLNHENVSARDLAERLHVSVRTIQRDMLTCFPAGCWQRKQCQLQKNVFRHWRHWGMKNQSMH